MKKIIEEIVSETVGWTADRVAARIAEAVAVFVEAFPEGDGNYVFDGNNSHYESESLDSFRDRLVFTIRNPQESSK